MKDYSDMAFFNSISIGS